jgi:hypothetical protein
MPINKKGGSHEVSAAERLAGVTVTARQTQVVERML